MEFLKNLIYYLRMFGKYLTNQQETDRLFKWKSILFALRQLKSRKRGGKQWQTVKVGGVAENFTNG